MCPLVASLISSLDNLFAAFFPSLRQPLRCGPRFWLAQFPRDSDDRESERDVHMPTILHLCRWNEPERRDTDHQGGDSEADICFKAVYPTVSVLLLGMMGEFFQTENTNIRMRTRQTSSQERYLGAAVLVLFVSESLKSLELRSCCSCMYRLITFCPSTQGLTASRYTTELGATTPRTAHF